MFVSNRKAWVAGLLAAALCISSAAQAQTTTTSTSDVKNFEILGVDGNYVVVRDQNGTRELHVPSDFRFNVDGKSLGVADLRVGMKGTAVVTKTTTTRPVYVTTVKKGTVINQEGRSVLIKEDNGKTHKFTQSEVDARGIQLYIGDKPKRIFDLNPGDTISATIVTAGPPEVLTQTQVDAELAKAPPPAPAPAPAPAAAEPEPAPAAAAPAAEPEAAPAEAAPTPEAAPAPEAMPAPAPAEEPSRTWLWVVLVLILVLVIWLVARNRNKDKNKQ